MIIYTPAARDRNGRITGSYITAHAGPLGAGEVELAGCIFDGIGSPNMGDWQSTGTVLAAEAVETALQRLLPAETLAMFAAAQLSVAQRWAIWETLEPGAQPTRLDPQGSARFATLSTMRLAQGRRPPRIVAAT